MICASRAISFISLLTLAASLPLSKRNIWVPIISYPNSQSRWCVGSYYHIAWSTDNQPAKIDNPWGSVFLNPDSGNSSDTSELATHFPLTDGQIEIKTPVVTPGMYKIALFGADGNSSPSFYLGPLCQD